MPSAIVGALSSAENFRADGQMNFVHQTGAEQCVVQFAAAFAKQPSHVPFGSQPAQCRAKIDFRFAADFHFVGHGAELVQLFFASALRGQNDDG